MASAVSGVFICVGILPLVFITAQNIDSISVADFRPVDNLNDEIFMMRQANTDQSTIVPENSAAYIESSNIAGIIAPRSESILPSTMYDFDNYLRDLNASVDGFWGTGPQTDADTRTGREKRHAKKRRNHKHRSHHRKSLDFIEEHNSDNETTQLNAHRVDEFVDVPKDLNQAHLTPGVIFRVHLTEAVIKMQYRHYAIDADSSIVEADTEYLRLARKLLSDELEKFSQLDWLMHQYAHRTRDLVTAHSCSGHYYTLGSPKTNFSSSEENMKRWCLFESVFVDRVPYVVGADGSLIGAVAPPVLQCDAATCVSVPFVDAVMFEQKLQATDIRQVTECQAECRRRCTNHVGCLESCNSMCNNGPTIEETVHLPQV